MSIEGKLPAYNTRVKLPQTHRDLAYDGEWDTCLISWLLYYPPVLFLVMFQPVLHNWYNKGCGMCYPVSGMVHMERVALDVVEVGLLFHYEWSFTICLAP